MAPISLISDVQLFTPGRACAGPLAVVLHGYSSGLEVLDAEMQRCPRPRPAQSPGCHTSFHYGVGVGGFHQYVLTANTAWGFGLTPPTCPEPICPPDPCASCTGLTVDQYNPDLDGNPPVLPALVAGPDGTANCGVIHVAVTGQALGFDLDCCRFFQNPQNYQQFVIALCQIFTAAGLVPSQSTLLVHCEELICLDIDQLVLDVLAADCVFAPVSPCIQCPPGSGLTVLDTDTVDLTLAVGVLSADVLISGTAGNDLVALPDGLFVDADAASVTITALDTSCINTTVTEGPPNTFVVSAVPIISPNADNVLDCLVNGLYVEAFAIPAAPVCVPELAHLPLVLGNDGAGGAAVWGKPQRPAMLTAFVTTGLLIDPSTNNDLYLLTGAGGGDVDLLPPVDCEKTDLWIKNISDDVFTVNSAELIDGVATIDIAGTIPGGYPFSNNGGEAVHVIWTGTTWYIV